MGTHYKGSSKEIKILNAYIKFQRASNSLNARLSRHRAADKLTISQFGVLETLHHLGPMNQKDISTKLLSSGSNLVTVIDNLEKNGLVERVRDSHDRRNIIVSLTAAGSKMIKEVFPKHLKAIVDEFSNFTNDELEELGRLSKKLGKKE